VKLHAEQAQQPGKGARGLRVCFARPRLPGWMAMMEHHRLASEREQARDDMGEIYGERVMVAGKLDALDEPAIGVVEIQRAKLALPGIFAEGRIREGKRRSSHEKKSGRDGLNLARDPAPISRYGGIVP
jgi:hypothetical protein